MIWFIPYLLEQRIWSVILLNTLLGQNLQKYWLPFVTFLLFLHYTDVTIFRSVSWAAKEIRNGVEICTHGRSSRLKSILREHSFLCPNILILCTFQTNFLKAKNIYIVIYLKIILSFREEPSLKVSFFVMCIKIQIWMLTNMKPLFWNLDSFYTSTWWA